MITEPQAKVIVGVIPSFAPIPLTTTLHRE